MVNRNKTAAEYAAIALAPILIFIMISSLANFLMLILYHGQYGQRVSWTILMSTMGAVALARIAIEQSRAYSMGYAFALGAATFIGMTRFVGSPLFCLFILGLIGYLADRIVHDCTIIDESQDSSGSGLIDSGRLFIKSQFAESTPSTESTTATTESSDPKPAVAPSTDVVTSEPPLKRKPRRRKQNQPGRTVMYLAIGALPLFGLGQFMMATDSQSWSAAQWYLAIYLFSALSLLVTTSFLGLRRYLRQRDAEMPTNVTVGWLAGGITMIMVVLTIAYMAPMPGQLLAGFRFPDFLDSPNDQTASRYGWGDEGAQDGPDDAAQTPNDPDENQKESAGERYERGAEAGNVGQGNRKDGPAGSEKGGDKSGAKGDDQSEQKGGDSKSEKQQGGEKSEDSKQSEKSDSSSNSEDQKQADSKQSADQSDQPSESETDEDGSDDPKTDDSEQSKSSESERQKEQQKQPTEQNRQANDKPQPAQSPPSSPSMDIAGSLGTLFKFLIAITLLAAIAGYVWIYRDHLRRWLEDLLGKRPRPTELVAVDGPSIGELDAPPRPFATFKNPIGTEPDPRRVLVITFQAFEAWTREQGWKREKDETPTEFISRVSAAVPQVSAAAAQVVNAYNRIVYGNGRPSQADLNAASKVWGGMR